MINNSEDFSRVYSDLLSRHRYRDLVGLLSSTTFNDDATRDTATKLMEKFQEQADIEDKLLEGADDNTKRAYRFITTGPIASDISTDESNPLYNSPSSRFMRGWNSLVDENDNNISIKFSNENQYNKFIESLGGNEAEIRNKGVNLGSEYTISFKSDINDKIGVYTALSKSGLKEELDLKLKTSLYAEPGIQHSVRPDINYLNKAEQKFYNSITAMDNVVKEANDSYANLFNTKNVKPYLNEMIVTGYMGEDDRQLQQSFSAGLIDLQSFKAMREILEEKYNRVLQTKSLSQYDVWAMNEDNEGSQVLEPLDDSIAKSKIDVEINQAIADGRLHYSHATNGLDIGTMLVIDPKLDTNGKVIEGSKTIRLFVKDLFRSQAENALRDDTQITAQRQYAKHQTYGHIYRSADGGTIDNWDQVTDSAVYTDKNGVTQNVGKAQILDILDNDVVAKRMIEYYNLANKVDKDGNGYTEEFYKVYGGNGFNSKTLYDNISARAYAAMAKKYEGQSKEFINYKAQELVSTILKGMGVDFENYNSSTGEITNNVLLRNTGINLK